MTGDLFKQDTSLVIGMADTFDVETPHIISKDSVQGQFLERVYHHDVAALRGEVNRALAGKAPTGSAGNKDRYPLGTVATITDHRTHYFCVAYASLDENNKASSTIGVLWGALEQLWDEVRIHSNGEAVSAPVIGLGHWSLHRASDPGCDPVIDPVLHVRVAEAARVRLAQDCHSPAG